MIGRFLRRDAPDNRRGDPSPRVAQAPLQEPQSDVPAEPTPAPSRGRYRVAGGTRRTPYPWEETGPLMVRSPLLKPDKGSRPEEGSRLKPHRALHATPARD